MSDNVSKLKELLFQSEGEALAELTSRVTAVYDRVGTEARFRSSVATVLDGAIKDAELERHDALTEAVSPLVVSTVKTEIRNSQDELVEALYPMTGRMVKAYVASAMKDLANDINRRLENNAFMLRLQSLMTGRSVADLAMASSQKLEVEELYLIRRGSGALVSSWPDTQGASNRNQVMSGVLTAINEFASEAFESKGDALRLIDLGDSQVYLRMSPAHLLAAKCTGTAHAKIENLIDEAFLTAIEQQGGALRNGGQTEVVAASGLLATLAENLPKQIAEQHEVLAAPAGARPVTMLAWFIGLPLAAWIGWTVYTNIQTARVRAIAERIIAAEVNFKGYPTGLDIGQRGRSVAVSGLAPSQTAKDNLVSTLKVALPSTVIQDDMGVLPAGVDFRPDVAILRRDVAGTQKILVDLGTELSGARRDLNTLERSTAAIALERAASDLEAVRADLKPLVSDTQIEGHADAKRVGDLATDVLGAVAKVQTAIGAAGGADPAKLEAEFAALRPLTARITAAATSLQPLLPAPPAERTAAPKRAGAAKSILVDADDLAEATDRLSDVALALAQGATLRRLIPPPAVPAAAPTARDQFQQWAREHAVFFAQNADFRNEDTAAKTLDDAARLVLGMNGLVRVVGYTDELGSAGRNSSIGQARADRVFGELIRRGIPPERLVVISRSDAADISPARGTGSPNRRVQFELGFEGELTP